MWLPNPGSTTTRDFRPLPSFGTIEKHYRLRRGILGYPHIYESLALHIMQPRLAALTDLRTGAGQAPLTTSRTAPHDSRIAPTDLPHILKTAPSEPCPSAALAVISGMVRTGVYRLSLQTCFCVIAGLHNGDQILLVRRRGSHSIGRAV